MTPLFKKLNLGAFTTVHVLNAPSSFEPELQALSGVSIQRSAASTVGFAMAFVTTLAQVEQATQQLAAHAVGDATLWMVYPKASSRKFKCEFNRDNGWDSLGAAGYEPVRQVAIDDDWSALRFRKAAYIKTMKRHPAGAISSEGKVKVEQQRGHSD
ncbi:hypothetical protein [Ideonella margarita]|uniref:DUF3052 domain-containing protein n=1 Tax=Ideonella margarita TaxID=2984191 RepID=A0ABU9C6P0_9BURK